MRLVYKESLVRRIHDAIEIAKQNGKEVEVLLLSKVEHERLCSEIGIPISSPVRMKQFLGVEVKVVDAYAEEEI